MPEIDVTEELGPKLLYWYLPLVGILRWAIELGGIDNFHEILLMSQYQANNWIDHLEVLYHIFDYLKSHTKMGRIGYYTIGMNVELLVLNDNADWTNFYGDVDEELLPQMPEPRGMAVSIHSFVDANHAGNVVKMCSHTKTIIFI